MPLCDEFVNYCQNFVFKIRRVHQNNFLWASRLWIGRRKKTYLRLCAEKRQKRIQAVKGYRKWKFRNLFNPLWPCVTNLSRIAKISILKWEGIIKKNSYERRDYESVQWRDYVRKNDEKKKNSGSKRLKLFSA